MSVRHNTVCGRPPGTVIVTGGGRGVGRATALRLAQDGYDVIVTYYSSEREAHDVARNARDLGVQSAAIQLHLDGGDLSAWFAQIDSAIASPLIGLVNNAVAPQERKPFRALVREDWMKAFQVNVLGCMELIRLSAARMARSTGGFGGSIVNLSSQIARFGAADLVPYATSKGAIESSTVSLARALGPEGIRLNVVSPGPIASDNATQLTDRETSFLEQIPLRRLCSARDVADAIAWLISPQSDFVTGTILPVHGGR